MILPIWKTPLLSVDDRLEEAYGEIDRLNWLLKKNNKTRSRVTEETWLFMEWAGSQPVELEDKHLDELGYWCWQAWQARAKLWPNAELTGRGPKDLSNE